MNGIIGPDTELYCEEYGEKMGLTGLGFTMSIFDNTHYCYTHKYDGVYYVVLIDFTYDEPILFIRKGYNPSHDYDWNRIYGDTIPEVRASLMSFLVDMNYKPASRQYKIDSLLLD